MQRCSGGAAINAVMQRCSDAAMLAFSLVLAGQPQASACPVVIRREARPAPVNFWSGRFSCGVQTCQRAHDACSATCFQGRGGTEVHGANRGHGAREAVGRL
jgi:hypothetical protein